MSTKKQAESKKRSTNTYVLLAVLLGLSFLMNLYLFQKTNTQVYDEPNAIKNMGTKYKELLKTMPEDKAQAALIKWVQEDPQVITSSKFDDKDWPGISFDYCAGSLGGGHNSWYNLKNTD